MDVDVDLVRGEIEEQRRDRMAVAREHIGVGAAHRADEQLVAHGAAVDEQELLGRGAARIGGQARVAGETHIATRDIDGERVFSEVGAEDGGEAAQAAVEQVAGFGGGF
jgi:hypothetical protein